MYWRKRKLKYDILIHIIVKPFEEFAKQETEEYFNWYISKIPKRVQYLSTYSGVFLDYSLDSLVDIWVWFIKIAEKEKNQKIRINELKEQLKGLPKDIADTMLQENTEQLSIL